jgi:hypothetical protein
MKVRALLPLALLASGLLSGCASTPRVIPMAGEASSQIRSTEIILALSQQEIAAEINQSNVAAAAGGGLLMALIDTAVNQSRAADAEKAIASLKNALVDYEFGKQLRAALEQELGRLSWINLQGSRTESSPDTKKIDEAVARSTANAVLVVNTTYTLSPDFSSVKVKATVTGYPKTPELSTVAKKARPDTDPPLLYRNDFSAATGIGKPYPSPAAAASAWAEDNGKAARAALNSGAADLAKRIAADLELARANYRAGGTGTPPAGATR